MHGFFDTDFHEVSQHFATHEDSRPRGLFVQLAEWRSGSKNTIKMGFVFIPLLKSKHSHLNLSKLSRKSAICARRPQWLLIVLVRSLRSARLDIVWLVKSVTYFHLIGWIGGCVCEF